MSSRLQIAVGTDAGSSLNTVRSALPPADSGHFELPVGGRSEESHGGQRAPVDSRASANLKVQVNSDYQKEHDQTVQKQTGGNVRAAPERVQLRGGEARQS